MATISCCKCLIALEVDDDDYHEDEDVICVECFKKALKEGES